MPGPRRLCRGGSGFFHVDDVAVVRGGGSPELILEAARACPAAAITVIDEETGEMVYPT